MAKLILMRHGASIWNEKNLFTGWVDIPLSPKGIEEAISAGRLLKKEKIDVVFSSALIRAISTALYVMEENDQKKVVRIIHSPEEKMGAWGKIYSPETEATTVPLYTAWELNERMYGDLQGLNKDETRKKFGEEQVAIWRRSFRVAPPHGESLEMTAARTLPYFESVIVPQLQAGKNVFVSAHGNSLRSIIMHLNNLSEEEILLYELPTGKPLLYFYEKGLFRK